MPEPRVTKAELLRWAADMSGEPCSSLDEMRSGVVLLRTFLRVFPKLADRPLKFKMQPRWDWEIALNWDAVEQCCIALSLPADMVDRPGLQAVRFRAIYNLLVALFFMYHVARDRDFQADFAHPIDGPVAHFLQARARGTEPAAPSAAHPHST